MIKKYNVEDLNLFCICPDTGEPGKIFEVNVYTTGWKDFGVQFPGSKSWYKEDKFSKSILKGIDFSKRPYSTIKSNVERIIFIEQVCKLIGIKTPTDLNVQDFSPTNLFLGGRKIFSIYFNGENDIVRLEAFNSKGQEEVFISSLKNSTEIAVVEDIRLIATPLVKQALKYAVIK